jgi:DNA-binding response OmpR family regulator
MLPDGNGFDLMKQLKSKSDYPVLFLTARGENDDKFLGFGLGADDYIPLTIWFVMKTHQNNATA